MPLHIPPNDTATPLGKHVSELKSYIPESKKRKALGGINEFRTATLSVQRELRDPEKGFEEKSDTTKVAILKPSRKHSEKRRQEIDEETKIAIGHLRDIENKKTKKPVTEIKEPPEEPVEFAVKKETGETFSSADYKGVYTAYQEPHANRSTQFIQNVLSYGKSGKVSHLATGSLIDWFSTTFRKSPAQKANEDLLREIIAQMLMAIDALHSNDKVHRDLKTENFLIYVLEGRCYVELADIDTISNANETTSSTYTSALLAPEAIREGTQHGDPQDYRMDDDKYPTLDKKAIDCYAIGVCLQEIYHQIIQPNDKLSLKFKDNFYHLSSGLARNKPEQRNTIEIAMNDKFFGETPEERQKYFQDIRDKHRQKDEYFDSYYRRRGEFYSEKEDTFFLLPARLKEICVQAESLQSKMQYVQDMAEGNYGDAENPHFDKNHVEIVRNNIENLKKLIAEYGKNEPKAILASLKKDITDAEILLSSLEVSSYFSALEKKPEYAHLVNDKHLPNFLNNRSDEQKRIDLNAALVTMRKYIDALPKNDPVRGLLEPYCKNAENQKSHIPLKELPNVTELTYRLLHKVQNPGHRVNEPRGANTQCGLAAAKKISGWEKADILKGLGMFLIGGVLVAAAVVTLMASFGAAAPLSAALGAIGVSVTASAITATIGVSTAAAGVSASVVTGAGIVGLDSLGAAGYGAAHRPYVAHKVKRMKEQAHSILQNDSIPAPEKKEKAAAPEKNKGKYFEISDTKQQPDKEEKKEQKQPKNNRYTPT
ncbi:MAG TPA: hypothetical protein VLI69_08925 [Gammaproteobacteria bacterium]|nr:hypothetical protein [Gammaproteobacteria bacterium]